MKMKKESLVWLLTILFVSIFASAIGNTFTHSNIIGGIILVLILFMIPFGIEIVRGNDPIIYYGLDFESLRKIDVRFVLSVAIVLFVLISLIDYFVFNLFDLLLKSGKNISVGSAAVALAKSNGFYLVFVVFFSGTLLEELWFRGFIQYKLNSLEFLRPLNPHFAIVVQSTLFALAHFLPVYYGTNLSHALKLWFFIYPFVVGLINGYINENYNSLWPGWIVHYTNNVFATFLLSIIYRV